MTLIRHLTSKVTTQLVVTWGEEVIEAVHGDHRHEGGDKPEHHAGKEKKQSSSKELDIYSSAIVPGMVMSSLLVRLLESITD